MSDVTERLKKAREELEAAQSAYEEEQRKPDVWEPEGGWWWVGPTGAIKSLCSAEETRKFGVERKNQHLAERAAEKMRFHNLLLVYVHEHAPDWDGSEPHTVWCNALGLYLVSPGKHPDLGAVTGPEWVMEKLADDLNSGRFK